MDKQLAKIVLSGAGRQIFSGASSLLMLSVVLDQLGQVEFSNYSEVAVFSQLAGALVSSGIYSAIYIIFNDCGNLLNEKSFYLVSRVQSGNIFVFGFLGGLICLAVYFLSGATNIGAVIFIFLTIISGSSGALALGQKSYGIFNFSEIIPACLNLLLVFLIDVGSASEFLLILSFGLFTKIFFINFWFFGCRQDKTISFLGKSVVGNFDDVIKYLLSGYKMGWIGAMQNSVFRFVYFCVMSILPIESKYSFASAWQFAEKSLMITAAANAVMYGRLGKIGADANKLYKNVINTINIVWFISACACLFLGVYVYYKEKYGGIAWRGVSEAYFFVGIIIFVQSFRSQLINVLISRRNGVGLIIDVGLVAIFSSFIIVLSRVGVVGEYFALIAAAIISVSSFYLLFLVRREFLGKCYE